jgi:hypothetical protein
MYGFVSKLLLSRKLKFEKGKIILLNQPMAFVPVDFFIEETKRVLKGKEKEEMVRLYFDAWKAGVFFMRDFTKGYNVRKFEDRYNLAMEIISMAGFGDYQTVAFKGGVFSHFNIINNPIAEFFYPSKSPVDFITRGFNAGGGTIVHETIINTIETACKAVNGKMCTHISANPSFLGKYKDQKLVSEQLDLEWLLSRQIEFIKDRKFTGIVKTK